ncbi:hypothetical protein D917_02059 [Trichinella nativa]|uniref:Uncharacterized protein n=1 Tax=Trichinella nativa TaxID=6335 RepID=A0A1Y3EIN3_9BILA|nr:hypothetical protein D917_02059 [Trichinella nativa]
MAYVMHFCLKMARILNNFSSLQTETEEWFPFGKPGSGAPLKSRNDLPLRNSPYTSNNGCFGGDAVNNGEINFSNKSFPINIGHFGKVTVKSGELASSVYFQLYFY